MTTRILSLLMSTATATASIVFSLGAQAEPVGGQVLLPDSSIEQADHIGRTAHTNTKIFVPTGGTRTLHPSNMGKAEPETAPGTGFYETPASLGCVYGLVAASPGQTGCNPTDPTLANPSGGSKA